MMEDTIFGRSMDKSFIDKLFKTQCIVDEINDDNPSLSDESFKDEMLKDISIGYTTSENKLN